VGTPVDAVGVGQGGNAAGLGDASGAAEVGVDDADRFRLKERAELEAIAEGLAGAERCFEGGRKAGIGVEVVGREGILPPADVADAVEFAADFDRFVELVGA